MKKKYDFGNNPKKINKYKKFWNREKVQRPLIGFTFRGFFPREEFEKSRDWDNGSYLYPDMISPQSFFDDHINLLKEGENINDDIIRGDSPAAAVIPWLSGMLGSKLKISPGNVIGEDLKLPWSKLENICLDKTNSWYKKYIEFALALSQMAQARFPVSHGAFRGPSDLHALLRGTEQSIYDLYDYPKKSKELLNAVADIFIKITEDTWEKLPKYCGGYFDGMYQLWSPGPIARLQEDVSSLYSPKLYKKFLLPIDKKIAKKFPCTFIHLHPSSIFLLNEFLENEYLDCFEINYEENSLSIKKLIPYYKRVQKKEKSLIIRGKLTNEDVKLILNELDYKGLYLLILVENIVEIEKIKKTIKDITGSSW